MWYSQLGLMAGVIAILVTLFFLLKNKLKSKANLIEKFVSIALAIVFFVRYFLSGNSLLDGVMELNLNNPFSSKFLCFMVAVCVWLRVGTLVALTIFPFFKQYKILANYIKTYGLFSACLNVIFFSWSIYALSGSYGWSAIGVLFIIEQALSLCYSVYVLCTTNYYHITKSEWIEMAIALPIVLISSVSVYLPGLFFKNRGYGLLKKFNLYHRIYLYITVGVLLTLYFLLKKKNDKEYSRMALLFVSLCTCIVYNYHYDFSVFITPRDWPLHLCNTAMYIVPICLIFKTKGLYYFTMFINIIGALLAMFMPNTSAAGGFVSRNIVSFWINHICAFALPALMVLLGVYERPKLKNFIYSMLWFMFYFALVLALNAIFTGIDPENPTDFFFINSDFVAEKLGKSFENLRNYTWDIPIGNITITFYPVYQALFFVVYIFIGLGMWFAFAWIFQMQDFYFATAEKNKKIKLDELALCAKYNEKEINKCMNKDSVNKLVVRGVYKQYGNSKYYSTQDVNMEVKAGEIFGFLGPNGAGKSTIIKCIVGIQPATKGDIEINGYDIAKQPVMAKQQFGFVPDHYALYEKLTGREYVNYIADLYGVSKADRDERLNKYVTMLDMTGSFDNPIRTYSHGMKQKIAIMSALVHAPKLWILDEPLTGLDPTSIYQVKECMKEHAKNGNIVFFSSHIIDIVEKLCDRIAIIKNGQIQTVTTLKELQAKGVTLEEYYLQIINDKSTPPRMKVGDENKIKEEKVEKPAKVKTKKVKEAK